MTEDEAKTKWCPFYRTCASGHYMLDNRAPNDPGHAESAPPFDRYHCIGSACIAWRATDNEGGPWSPDEEKEPVSKPAGYCGLAGKP